MDNLLIQEISKQNSKLSKEYNKIRKENENLKKALKGVALPALKEYQKYERHTMAKIAESALKKILELLQAG